MVAHRFVILVNKNDTTARTDGKNVILQEGLQICQWGVWSNDRVWVRPRRSIKYGHARRDLGCLRVRPSRQTDEPKTKAFICELAYIRRMRYPHLVHLACFPLPLERCDFDVA